MNKTSKKISSILIFVIALLVVVSVVSIERAFASDILEHLNTSAIDGGLATANTSTNLSLVMGRILGAMLSLTGVIFMAIIVYGGNLWMTARGNEEQVEKAKKLITNAVMGLLLIVGSYAITWFLVDVISNSAIGTPAVAP